MFWDTVRGCSGVLGGMEWQMMDEDGHMTSDAASQKVAGQRYSWKGLRWRRFVLRLWVRQWWARTSQLIQLFRHPELRAERVEKQLKERVVGTGSTRRRAKNSAVPKQVSKMSKAALCELLLEFGLEKKEAERMTLGELRTAVYEIPADAVKGETKMKFHRGGDRVTTEKVTPKGKCRSKASWSTSTSSTGPTKADEQAAALRALRTMQAKKEQKKEGDPTEDRELRVGRYKGMMFSEVMFQKPEYAVWAIQEVAKGDSSKGLEAFAQYLLATASRAADAMDHGGGVPAFSEFSESESDNESSIDFPGSES